MRHFINLIESQDVNFVHQSGTNYKVVVGGETVASFLIDKDAYEDAYCVHLVVSPEHRRKGVGDAIYDFVEAMAKESGRILRPSRGLSEASYRYWLKRDPTMVADFRKIGNDTWGNPKRA